MEHLIQFAIGIDDDAIAKKIEANAEKQIIQTLTQQVRNKLFHGGYSGNANEYSPLNDFSKQIVEKFLINHKDEIIEKAALYLADKLARTKAGKELLKVPE